MKIFKKLYQNFRCNRIVHNNVYKRAKYNDRSVLEQIIIPHVLAYNNPQKIFDIGREDYQGFYNEFFKGRELWTLDIDEEREEFGSPGHHITDDVSNAGSHFEENFFNFILINGVLGWGLNNKNKIEKAFNGIYKIMSPKGILVVGWNDFEDIKIFKPKEIKALKLFKPFFFKPLKSEEFECDNGCHKYSFYIK